MTRLDQEIGMSNLHRAPPSASPRMDHFCVEWDQDDFDVDKWWSHHPGFVIEHQNTTHQCFQKEANPVKLRFLRRLHRNQFHNKCNAVLPRLLRSSGWGADFNGLGKGLLLALLAKKPMIFVPNPLKPATMVWQYGANQDGTSATCPSKDIDCYFLPITKCPTNRSHTYDVDTSFHEVDGETWPWVYQYLTRGQQWVRRAVVTFVENQRPPFPSNESCTVMHVRRGDVIHQKSMPASKQSRGYHPISAYLDQLPNERRQPGSNILLLTDDANAIDEALEFHSHINWHWVNRTRRRGRDAKFMHHITEPTPKDEVIAILGTFEIAKTCDAVVRGVSSFGDFINSQVMDACREKGKTFFSGLVSQEFASERDRRKSDKLLEATLKKMRAAKRGSLES